MGGGEGLFRFLICSSRRYKAVRDLSGVFKVGDCRAESSVFVLISGIAESLGNGEDGPTKGSVKACRIAIRAFASSWLPSPFQCSPSEPWYLLNTPGRLRRSQNMIRATIFV